ncbi:MAG: GNAT family N-acetyltransferase [Thermoanaerobaculia bacterium]|nr:GNAT family N-acetyltransferase [Thermoanaerobaculia bacterium]
MNGTEISLRPARREDVPVVARLIRDLADYERLADECFADASALEEHLFGARPYVEVILAEVDGAPAGFALFFHSYSTFLTKPGLYLEDLYVVPERRGLGLGRRLLGELARLAVERGCGRLEWSVLKWNSPAIGFYERLGAVPMAEWQVYRLTGEPLRALAGRAARPAGDA